jgi:hypothetical protein
MLVMSAVMAFKEQLREMVFSPKGIPCVMDKFDWQIFLKGIEDKF